MAQNRAWQPITDKKEKELKSIKLHSFLSFSNVHTTFSGPLFNCLGEDSQKFGYTKFINSLIKILNQLKCQSENKNTLFHL